LAVLKLAVLVSGVLVLAKLGFLDFITGGFDTGRFEGLPLKTIDFKPIRWSAAEPNLAALTADQKRTVSGLVFFT
jgi:hypothetical protein